MKHLWEQKATTPLQHACLSKLMGYDFDIAYKKGEDNSVANALSRESRVDVFNITISSLQPLLLDQIVSSYTADVVVQHLLL